VAAHVQKSPSVVHVKEFVSPAELVLLPTKHDLSEQGVTVLFAGS